MEGAWMEGGYRARCGETEERAAAWADEDDANAEESDALEPAAPGGTATDRFGDLLADEGGAVRRDTGVKVVGARELLPTTLALPPLDADGAPPLDDPCAG